MKLVCPKCGNRRKIDDSKLGKTECCPVCHLVFLVPKAEPGSKSQDGFWPNRPGLLMLAGAVVLMLTGGLILWPIWKTNTAKSDDGNRARTTATATRIRIAASNPVESSTKENPGPVPNQEADREVRFPVQLLWKGKKISPNASDSMEIVYRKTPGYSALVAAWMAEVELTTEEGQSDRFTVTPRQKQLAGIRLLSPAGTFSQSSWSEWITAGFDVDGVKGKGILRFALADFSRTWRNRTRMRHAGFLIGWKYRFSSEPVHNRDQRVFDLDRRV